MVNKKSTTKKDHDDLWENLKNRTNAGWPLKKTLKDKVNLLGHSVFLLEIEVRILRKSVEKLDNKMDSIKNELSRSFDEVLKEIRESRDDRSLVAHRVTQHDDQIEEHEGRIHTLEKQFSVS